MRIVHIASEMAPIAKIGGLGDVLLGLPLDLQNRGHDTCVILPKYSCIKPKGTKKRTFTIPYDGKECKISLWQTKVHGLKVWLLEDHTKNRWLKRTKIYGYKDDSERFAFFAAAALKAIETSSKKTDIVHLHDWHSAPVAHMAHMPGTRFILTLHNPQYQGHVKTAFLKKLGVIPLAAAREGRRTNLLKLGMLTCDFITTVSPTFAQETLYGKVHFGVGKILRAKKARYCGILNGIDYTVWDPNKDPYIKAHLNLKKFVQTATRSFKNLVLLFKKSNKTDLQKVLKLEKSDKPIIACITRLVEQKGLDLIQHAIRHTKKRGGQFVLLGSQPSDETRASFEKLKKKLKAPHDIYMRFEHDERIAHKIFAGSDMFIIPSIFEPCGLTQMIAMRFGTVPIGRKTGGLADTIHDIDNTFLKEPAANGFIFDKPTKASIEKTIDRALGYWEKKPTDWQHLIQGALNSKFDWGQSGAQYLDLYEELLAAS